MIVGLLRFRNALCVFWHLFLFMSRTLTLFMTKSWPFARLWPQFCWVDTSRRETMLATNVSNNKIGVTGNFLKDRDDKISLEPILLLCLRLYNILIWETAPPPPAQPCCDNTFLWWNWLYSGSSCRFITGVTLKYHLFNQESNFRDAGQTSKPPYKQILKPSYLQSHSA